MIPSKVSLTTILLSHKQELLRIQQRPHQVLIERPRVGLFLAQFVERGTFFLGWSAAPSGQEEFVHDLIVWLLVFEKFGDAASEAADLGVERVAVERV